MPRKDGDRQIGFGLPEAAAERLSAECTSSVASYVRALVEGQTWALTRAVERLRDGRVSEEELLELAAGAEAQRRPPSLLEAAALVVEARAMGRDPMKEVDHG